jgi:aspartate racemase
MKTIGLIGGMSWESTITYYQLINQGVHKRLGGVHSARLLMHSFDFEDIAALQRAADWDEANAVLIAAGRGLVKAGADFLLICTNTMHLCACAVENELKVPLLHIADPLGAAIRSAGVKRVALLGTLFTMERPDVLRGRLKKKFDLDLLTPQGAEAQEVHRIIFEELVAGRFLESSRTRLRGIIAGLVRQGAEGVVLGCTELPLLVMAQDSPVPLFDTTALHAAAAVDYALEGHA